MRATRVTVGADEGGERERLEKRAAEEAPYDVEKRTVLAAPESLLWPKNVFITLKIGDTMIPTVPGDFHAFSPPRTSHVRVGDVVEVYIPGCDRCEFESVCGREGLCGRWWVGGRSGGCVVKGKGDDERWPEVWYEDFRRKVIDDEFEARVEERYTSEQVEKRFEEAMKAQDFSWFKSLKASVGELRFASVDEALQALADVSGCRVRVGADAVQVARDDLVAYVMSDLVFFRDKAKRTAGAVNELAGREVVVPGRTTRETETALKEFIGGLTPQELVGLDAKLYDSSPYRAHHDTPLKREDRIEAEFEARVEERYTLEQVRKRWDDGDLAWFKARRGDGDY